MGRDDEKDPCVGREDGRGPCVGRDDEKGPEWGEMMRKALRGRDDVKALSGAR